MFSRSERSRAVPEAVRTWCGGGYSDDSTTDTSSSSSDTEEMLVDTSRGKMRINLLANDTPNEYAIRYDSATTSTAGLVTHLQKFKDMHIRETLSSGPTAPSFQDNPTPTQSRRPQYWQTTPVGFSQCIGNPLDTCLNNLILSGNFFFRTIQHIFKNFFHSFHQQTLQKLYSTYTSQDPIPFSLYFTAPPLTDSGMMDYIIVILGLPVFAHAFFLWPVDGAMIGVSYQRIQVGRMGSWIGGKQAVSILN